MYHRKEKESKQTLVEQTGATTVHKKSIYKSSNTVTFVSLQDNICTNYVISDYAHIRNKPAVTSMVALQPYNSFRILNLMQSLNVCYKVCSQQYILIRSLTARLQHVSFGNKMEYLNSWNIPQFSDSNPLKSRSSPILS